MRLVMHAQKTISYSQLCLVALFSILINVQCTSTPPLLPPELPSASTLKKNLSNTLGVGDILEIRVYQEPELSGLYRVSAQGSFHFPLIGVIRALGHSVASLSINLTQKLKNGYLRSPQVSVFLKESHSKKVFILGKVKKPGTYKFDDGMSVVQAIALAGGLLPLAAPNLILIRSRTRTNVNVNAVDRTQDKSTHVSKDEVRYLIPFKKISQGSAPNSLLQPGDILFIPESWL
jgi:protein involved in polysaccharide export with SLBB domain